MSTAPVDRANAAAIEAAEARAWADCYAAAPPEFGARAGVGTTSIAGALAIRWAATGRRYFSRTIGLGVSEPATEAAIDAALAYWSEHGIDMWLLQSLEHCRPGAYEGWLRDRGLEPFDAQDRIVRGAAAQCEEPDLGGRELSVEKVGRESAEEWSDFIQRIYRVDTGAWLPALVGRPGWHHYVAREDGAIAGARTLFAGPDGMGWLGIDGPVPGVMTDDYVPDAAICARIVADGPALGAHTFLADIEAPSEAMDTPAYEHFGRLGFTRPYVRTHWTKL